MVAMKLKKKVFNTIFTVSQKFVIRNRTQDFQIFLFLKDCFRKQLKLYQPLFLRCDEDELQRYINFLRGIKKIIGCLIKKVYFFIV